MSIREKINRHAKVVSAAAVVAFLAATAVFLFYDRHPPRTMANTKAYFIDEETGEEMSRLVGDVPPLAGKSGKPTVVRAVYIQCDDCKAKTLVYLFKYTPEAKQKLEEAQKAAKGEFLQAEAVREMGVDQGMWVRAPQKGSEWHEVSSDEAKKLLSEIQCPNGKEHRTRPANP